MLVDKIEKIPFQKSPWNASCKNGILLKIPLFQNQILRRFFNQAPQQHYFCTINSLLMLQRSLGYIINKFRRFYRVPEKIVIFKKMKNYKILAVNLSSDCFTKNSFWSKTLTIKEKKCKRNWVSALLPSEMHFLSIGQGLTQSPMENCQVFL